MLMTRSRDVLMTGSRDMLTTNLLLGLMIISIVQVTGFNGFSSNFMIDIQFGHYYDYPFGQIGDSRQHATRCDFPKEVGIHCDSDYDSDSHPPKAKFWYNKDTDQCEKFYYNGCSGNRNRFDSYKKCMKKCSVNGPSKEKEPSVTTKVPRRKSEEKEEQSVEEPKLEKDCPYGWIKGLFGWHCHLYHSVPLSYNESLKFCQSQGGHMVTIDSYNEARSIEAHIDKNGKHDFWIGATDEGHEGKWVWSHGNRPLTPGYTNWEKTRASEPNNLYGNEHCAHLGNFKDNYYWNDAPCDLKKYALCEKAVKLNLNMSANSSSQWNSVHSPVTAIDGNFNTLFHSESGDSYPWLLVDMGRAIIVDAILVYIRDEQAGRFKNVEARVGDHAWKLKRTRITVNNFCSHPTGTPAWGMKTRTFVCDRPIRGRFMSLQILSPAKYNLFLEMFEIEVYGDIGQENRA